MPGNTAKLVVEKFPRLRQSICEKLTQTLTEIQSGKAASAASFGFWANIQAIFQDIRKVLGEIPILASEQWLLDEAGGEEDKKEDKKVEGSGRPKGRMNSFGSYTWVLADGTYATETAYTSANSARLEAVKTVSKLPLRALILGGDFFTGLVLASALTKLVL
ncbi:hypothetical protein EV702DRAFT_1047108 [Suillus placidus]|uniref:Uncharacterized protein n=1 Tax=Suillus placidus TaxID=48579 RepID=A0A9P6ZR52_9AGAM|nr:hypothetical protein EV702DRAFT_1047108 [Suillus placidus]